MIDSFPLIRIKGLVQVQMDNVLLWMWMFIFTFVDNTFAMIILL